MFAPTTRPALIDKGVSDDARHLAKRLENTPQIPDDMEPRLRALTNDLWETNRSVLQEGLLAELAVSLASPLAMLSQAMNRADITQEAEIRDKVRLALLGVAQAMDRFLDGAGFWAQQPSQDLIDWLSSHIAISQENLASWLDVAPRTLQRWKSGESTPGSGEEHRIRSLARVASSLTYSYTPVGVAQWLARPMGRFGDKTPIELLGDEDAVHQIEQVARGIRGI